MLDVVLLRQKGSKRCFFQKLDGYLIDLKASWIKAWEEIVKILARFAQNLRSKGLFRTVLLPMIHPHLFFLEFLLTDRAVLC